MGSLWEALVSAYAFLAIVPVLPFLLVFGVASVRSGDRQRAIRLAMDITTAFLIGIVASLINKLLGNHFGPYLILLFMLLGAGLIGNAQYRMRGKVNGMRLFRAIWRLSFFAMSVLYILLMLVELVKSMFGSEPV
ncbi:DUF3397 domain-containing protein [Cohnella nanjingensis]|uniref:DUF3397 domain-containing protein n=1 Tax=Cohnella nanjingensis TaxID=1387779 RepID=A0A7X0RT58_9BACL|nr:DUF3397 domain-containing protein [Cohnella nanjingensis]MBB6673233.1 DUF3397 domain-containing protein [Cohnella nanjingensis]